MNLNRMVFVFGLLLASGGAASAIDACNCSHFDKIRQEIENATTLRERFRAKADEIDKRTAAGEGKINLLRDYGNWVKDLDSGAGAGIETTVKSEVEMIGYMPFGNKIVQNLPSWTSPVTRNGYTTYEYDAALARQIEQDYKKKGQDLCAFDDTAKMVEAAEKSSPCKEVSDALVLHENSHKATCEKLGFIKFFMRGAAELARDEVASYDAQIAALQKLLGKALKGADVQLTQKSDLVLKAQGFRFDYAMQTVPAREKIPEHEEGGWSVTINAKAKVSGGSNVGCRIATTEGQAQYALQSDNKTAKVTLVTVKMPNNAMSCKGAAGQAKDSSPETMTGEQLELPFQSTSTNLQDLSKAKVAKMIPGATASGVSELKLEIICPAPK